MTEHLQPSLFTTKDVQVERARERLTAQPETVVYLRTLFNRQLVDCQNELVGLRIVDIGTLLNQCCDNFLPTDNPDNLQFTTCVPSADWYHVGILWSHRQYSNENGDSHPLATNSFEDDLWIANSVFSDVVFNSAFAQNVLPVMNAGWLDAARPLVAVYSDVEATEADYSKVLLYQHFMDNLKEELTDPLGERNRMMYDWYEESQKKPFTQVKSSNHFRIFLRKWLRDGVDTEAVEDYLLNVALNRGGVLVGFNERVFQGRWINQNLSGKHADPRNWSDGDTALIKPKTGRIELSADPISVLQVSGKYEQTILRELHILP